MGLRIVFCVLHRSWMPSINRMQCTRTPFSPHCLHWSVWQYDCEQHLFCCKLCEMDSVFLGGLHDFPVNKCQQSLLVWNLLDVTRFSWQLLGGGLPAATGRQALRDGGGNVPRSLISTSSCPFKSSPENACSICRVLPFRCQTKPLRRCSSLRHYVLYFKQIELCTKSSQ